MMDYMLLGHSSRMIFSDSANRCVACGHGPVMGGDGFLMTHCMNCGVYRHWSEPVDLGLGKLKDKVVAWIKRGAGRIFRKGLERDKKLHATEAHGEQN